MTDTPLVLSLDMGGSKFIVGLVDDAGEILASQHHAWTELTPEEVVRDVIGAAKALLAAHPQHRPAAIGATIPGLADAARGLWVESSFSGIRNLPIAPLLREALSLPAFIRNDIQACAMAERRFGCCRDTDDFLWVTVSNGIGGAIFAEGRLLTGSRGNAGEIGHVVVVEGKSARLCKCGHHGCAEIQASGWAVPLNYQELGGKPGPDAREIAQRARQGESTAQETWRLEGVYLGRAIGAAVNLLNPAKVVLGGGVALSFDLFQQPLLDTLKSHVYLTANPNFSVMPTPLGYHAALLGAAALGLQGLEHQASSQ